VAEWGTKGGPSCLYQVLGPLDVPGGAEEVAVGALQYYGSAKFREPSLVVVLDIIDCGVAGDMVAGPSDAVPPVGGGGRQPGQGVAERAEQRPTSRASQVVEQAATAVAGDNGL
jgi:hypothetical protein